MTERPLLSRWPGRTSRAGTSTGMPPLVQHYDTIPGVPVPPPAADDDPSLFGLPAEPDPGPSDESGGDAWSGYGPAEPAGRVVVRRRADAVAGSLLLVAGAAGGMSLFLPWLWLEGELGYSLAERGVEFARRGLDDLAGSGLLLPLGVVVAGGVLILLGLLAFRAARTHRVVGVLALFVSLAVATGIVVRTVAVGSATALTDPGLVCAGVLVGFGLLGALKAMLTVPEVTSERM